MQDQSVSPVRLCLPCARKVYLIRSDLMSVRSDRINPFNYKLLPLRKRGFTDSLLKVWRTAKVGPIIDYT